MTRDAALQRAIRLEYLTVGWNVVEGVIAVTAALVAGSVALLGFGIDSFVETASGLILLWRLRAESKGHDEAQLERLERRAERLVGGSLFALAAYVVGDAALTVWNAERPRPSTVGMILLGLSLAVMWWLAREKRKVATALGSRAMAADAFQTSACWWLSLAALAGVALNAALGWWWADPAAAVVMALFIAREGLEAWRGEDSTSAPRAGSSDRQAQSGAAASQPRRCGGSRGGR